MTIRPLVDSPETIPLLAGWFHAEWHTFDGRSISAIEGQLAENLNLNSIPITFVARGDAGVLGTVSLDLSDLPGFDHFSPWLASLYVLPHARGKGIGSALIRHVQQFASSRGIGMVYLWTPSETRLYERCGWTCFQRATYNDRSITLMRWPA